MSESMQKPELSGIDLARVALQAAREAARIRPADAPGGRGSTRRRGRSIRRMDGREPMTFGAAITELMAERAWEAPIAGGSVIDQWPDIAPELVGRVVPVRFDEDSGQLDLRPVSPAYATQLRLLGRQMIARINTKTGREAVKSIRVLPPGPDQGAQAGGAPGSASPTSLEAAEAAPVRTRETASAGYREALATVQAAKPENLANPAIRAAIERQNQALLRKREPEVAFTDGQVLRDQLLGREAAAADVENRARARARAEKAGRLPHVARVFDRIA
ncbi:DciA family protein [Streptomyces sp. NBC_01262]|uniref:DciA family protein n=1 Tax=Streptomyces sp. NBC_01262 TaxID=2903803 RepID=UPI002E373C23|nr:DciA family protein [Streptomyces sp. NBC_01262]